MHGSQTPDSPHRTRERSKCYSFHVEYAPKGLVPSWILLLGGRTFKKWDAVGGSWFTGGVSLRPQALSCPCFASHREGSSFVLCILSCPMFCVPPAQKQQGQITMGRNLRKCELRSILPPWEWVVSDRNRKPAGSFMAGPSFLVTWCLLTEEGTKGSVFSVYSEDCWPSFPGSLRMETDCQCGSHASDLEVLSPTFDVAGWVERQSFSPSHRWPAIYLTVLLQGDLK